MGQCRLSPIPIAKTAMSCTLTCKIHSTTHSVPTNHLVSGQGPRHAQIVQQLSARGQANYSIDTTNARRGQGKGNADGPINGKRSRNQNLVNTLEEQKKQLNTTIERQRHELRQCENKIGRQNKLIEEMKARNENHVNSLKKYVDLWEQQCANYKKVEAQLKDKNEEAKKQTVLYNVELGLLKTELERLRPFERANALVQDNRNLFNDIHSEPKEKLMKMILACNITLNQIEVVSELSESRLKECFLQLTALRGFGLSTVSEIQATHEVEMNEMHGIVRDLQGVIESESIGNKEGILIESLRRQNQLLLTKLSVSEPHVKSLIISLSACLQQQQKRLLTVLYKYICGKDKSVVPTLRNIYTEVFNKVLDQEVVISFARTESMGEVVINNK